MRRRVIGDVVNAIKEHVMPERLGNYPLLSVIGSGSMGMVYKSVDPRSGRPLAIKTLRGDRLDAGDSDALAARLRLEAQAAAGLDHPGIVAVLGYGEQGSWCYLVMEYVDGSSLQRLLEEPGRMDVARAVDITAQLLEALQYAHDHGVWHRDIKPANILATRSGRIKVTDFGIACIASIPGRPALSASALESLEVIMGTPGYVAPEAYQSETFDSRVDLFAAGAVLYRLLAGVAPFVGRADEILFQVCSTTPAAPSVAAGLRALQRFDAVVLKALARHPEDRFATAAEFRAALLSAHSGA